MDADQALAHAQLAAGLEDWTATTALALLSIAERLAHPPGPDPHAATGTEADLRTADAMEQVASDVAVIRQKLHQ